MNLNYLIKKNHIFKSRKKYKINIYKKLKFNYGVYSLNQFRFELVYFRVLKKLFRKKYFKRDISYLTKKYWLMVRPNFLLTMKSKNSRMGSGVGSYVRVSAIVKSNKPIILLKNYYFQLILNIIKYIKMKLNVNFYLNTYKSRNL